MLRRFILTGAPGSGKTSVLTALSELGYAVVPEAATDVIACAQRQGQDEPWREARFISRITTVQHSRQVRPVPPGTPVQFYDRSPVCTLALARYLGHDVPGTLTDEIERIVRERVYEPTVFFIRPIGFCAPTASGQRRSPRALAPAHRERMFSWMKRGSRTILA